MNRNERYDLLLKMKRKEITNREAAKHVGCSDAMISLFLRNKANMKESKIEKLKEYIEGKPERIDINEWIKERKSI
ncbi:XRE family transcriptional regulator [Alteribacillus sp. YIM 98480]|uniref:XRE family transcriptional regulator n=1 Tax=Alteribacillus sp. YIM 98480 TaxID=2606599 RepID=UPI00131E7BF1|nr:XRE family transcriptional regulator [Alteribacillus sp. YIM 98480]